MVEKGLSNLEPCFGILEPLITDDSQLSKTEMVENSLNWLINYSRWSLNQALGYNTLS